MNNLLRQLAAAIVTRAIGLPASDQLDAATDVDEVAALIQRSGADWQEQLAARYRVPCQSLPVPRELTPDEAADLSRVLDQLRQRG